MTEHALIMCREPGRHSTLDKGHEEGGSAYANAGRASGVHPDILEHLPPKKTGVCLLYCFVLSPLISLGIALMCESYHFFFEAVPQVKNNEEIWILVPPSLGWPCNL